MAYEKQTWACGDTITADKLNHMEDGIANAGGGSESLMVTETKSDDKRVLDKTWQEIYDAFPNAYVLGEDEKVFIYDVVHDAKSGKYQVTTHNSDYSASSSDGYPSRVGIK